MGRSWDDIAHPKATEDAIDRDAIDYFLKKGINSGRIDMGELQASTQMHVYDDRIEVWNEGLLPAGYTPETLLSRHSSRPRNKNIAFTFFKAGFIDRWGLGYKKIMEGFKEAGMKLPEIELVDGGVRVTVWRKNIGDNVTSVSPVVSPVAFSVQLTERQIKIIKMIQNDERVSSTEMSLVLSVSIKTIKRDLKEMQNMGIITHEGNTSAGRWIVLLNNGNESSSK